MSYFRKLSFEDMLSMVKAAAAKRAVIAADPESDDSRACVGKAQETMVSGLLNNPQVTIREGWTGKSIQPKQIS